MKPTRCILPALAIALGAPLIAQQPATAPTPAPTTRPTAPPKAEDLLKQMLKPTTRQSNPSLDPVTSAPAIDESTRRAVAPRSQPLSVIREGSFVFDRVGRLTRTNDGQPEFVFEADGQAMQDPPLLIHPNLKLMVMEYAVKNSARPPRFRVTGMITEYGNRNYILVEKAVVVPELQEKPLAR